MRKEEFFKSIENAAKSLGDLYAILEYLCRVLSDDTLSVPRTDEEKVAFDKSALGICQESCSVADDARAALMVYKERCEKESEALFDVGFHRGMEGDVRGWLAHLYAMRPLFGSDEMRARFIKEPSSLDMAAARFEKAQQALSELLSMIQQIVSASETCSSPGSGTTFYSRPDVFDMEDMSGECSPSSSFEEDDVFGEPIFSSAAMNSDIYLEESASDSAYEEPEEELDPIARRHAELRRRLEERRAREAPAARKAEQDTGSIPKSEIESAARASVPMPSPAPAPAAEAPGRQVKVSKMNKVDFSVVAAESVRPGKDSFVDVLMYTRSQRRIVLQAIKQASEKAEEKTKTAGSVSVRQGSLVTVTLSSDDAQIADPSETLMWSGDALDFKFKFTLPAGFDKGKADFSCSIQFDGVHISRLYFSVRVNTSKSVPVRVVRKDCRKAFVSYSHLDKQRVVNRLLAIQEVAPKLKFWMDNQSMDSGDEWRKEISKAITSSDVFLLFWSSSAKASAEVEKEWRYALKLEKKEKKPKNGARFISPVPLETPDKCPPPKELGDLHFGDPSFDEAIVNIDKLNFTNNRGVKAKNIKVIK